MKTCMAKGLKAAKSAASRIRWVQRVAGGTEYVQCSEEVKRANQRSDTMGIRTDVHNIHTEPGTTHFPLQPGYRL